MRMSDAFFAEEMLEIAKIIVRPPYKLADLLHAAAALDAKVSAQKFVCRLTHKETFAWRQRIYFLARTDLAMSSGQIGSLMNRDPSTVRKLQKTYENEAEWDSVALDLLRREASAIAKMRDCEPNLCA